MCISSTGKVKKRKGVVGDIHADLPITTILSYLEFSSDEEAVMDDLPCLTLDSWDNEWSDSKPPRSHTGGKWKPGKNIFL